MKTEQLIATLAAQLQPAPPARTPGTATLLWTAAAWLCGLALVAYGLGLRPDLSTALVSPSVIGLVLGPALLAAACARACLILAVPGRRLPWLATGPVWVLGFAVAVSIASLLPSSWGHLASGADWHGGRCGLLLTVCAVLPAALLMRSVQRRAPVRPFACGVLAGIAAGAIGWTVVSLHCPSLNAMHLLLYHALPVGLPIAVSGYAAHRWLRW